MTRIITWLLGSILATALLIGYDASTSPPSAGTETVLASPAEGERVAGLTFTGSTVDTRWGPVQVQITVADGVITDVIVLQAPDGNRRDEEINEFALPILVADTLSLQSADIDMVSGATVTYDGYVASLQSALDQAGL